MTTQSPTDQPARTTIARLALADGSVFQGSAFGTTHTTTTTAEVVFNTALTGYQESLTDPSYAGQILVQTTPLIGNTGANPQDLESASVQVAGLVVHEYTPIPSNYRATESLSDFLAASGKLGIADLDTRALTRLLRTQGVIAGVISNDPARSDADLVSQARHADDMTGMNLAAQASCKTEQSWGESLGEWSPNPKSVGGDNPDQPVATVLALDCGAKRNILRHLTDRNIEVKLAPFDTPASQIAQRFNSGDIQGLFISNGPGDPAAVEQTIQTLATLLDDDSTKDMPVFGICLGHQLLALASGAKTFKLKFGHRGANQPVHDLHANTIQITSQNHGFAVDPDSLPANAKATHLHLNDHTLAGFERTDRPVFSVQYHPEASPGPHDASKLFDRFHARLAR